MGEKIAALILLILLPLSSGFRKCPRECICSDNAQGLSETYCERGPWQKSIPVEDIDPKTQAIIIKSSKHTLTIGPIFREFKKLQVLRINNCNVPAIGTASFWGIISLKTLDLSRNNITQINEDNFKGQQNLNELDLSKNKIDRMPSGTFKLLLELKNLNLADNLLEELVPRLFLMLLNLKYLDLSGNPLEDLSPDVFKDVQNLKVLKCRRCRLQNINPHLYNLLPLLERLDLGDNQFKYLDKDEFKDLKRLRYLHLDGNQMSVIIDNLFQRQKNLEYLDISRNRLAKISAKAFDHLSNLTTLDISYNKLSVLEKDYMAKLVNLKVLNISGHTQMNLAEIKPTFQVLTEMRMLSMADMGSLPLGIFIPLAHIKALNVSGNHINNETLHILNPLTGLKELDISRNQLSGIEEDFVEKLLRIDDIKWDQNPFICDICHLEGILSRIHAIKWKSVPECFLPEVMRGKPINTLDKKALDYCHEIFDDEGHDAASTSYNILDEGNINMLAIAVSSSVVLLVLIVIIIATICNRQGAQYYTREDEKLAETSQEKCLEGHHQQHIANSEINFKFPLHDRVCTIDEICLPPPPPPPSKCIPKEKN